MEGLTRREFLPALVAPLVAQDPGQRPARPAGVEILNPRGRVPVSLIVDDSTCLANLARFAIPQFRQIYPDRYQQPWEELPLEIPDSFVLEVAEWCHDRGVKGKYSVVPYPACLGRLDRELPGWTRKALEESLKTVRSLAPDWDFHPEMVTHTRVIDVSTDRPYPQITERFMENWGWCRDKSTDEIGEYISYALRILKNAGIPCEGVTSPGGFGTGALAEYAKAVLQSLRDVFQVEIPHYVKHARAGDPSVAPRVHYASGDSTVVQIIAGTPDWFGGWDGLGQGSADRFVSKDFQEGRMVELIRRGEPAIMLGHWPGFYWNGERKGFRILQEVVRRLDDGFRKSLVWMKLSEIARYWAAKELTKIERLDHAIAFDAPFACPDFTIRVSGAAAVRGSSGMWVREGRDVRICFDLPKGHSRIAVS